MIPAIRSKAPSRTTPACAGGDAPGGDVRADASAHPDRQVALGQHALQENEGRLATAPSAGFVAGENQRVKARRLRRAWPRRGSSRRRSRVDSTARTSRADLSQFDPARPTRPEYKRRRGRLARTGATAPDRIVVRLDSDSERDATSASEAEQALLPESRTSPKLKSMIPRAFARHAAAAIATPSIPCGARANTRGRLLLVTDVCSQVAGI